MQQNYLMTLKTHMKYIYAISVLCISIMYTHWGLMNYHIGNIKSLGAEA